MVPPNNLGPDIQFSIVLCARYQSNPKISHLIAMKRILSYNNGNYVDHPTPETVKKELGKIAINPSYLDKTPVLKNSFPAAWRILFTFVIQGPEASGALSKKSKRPKSKKSPIETMVTLPKPTEGSEQSHSEDKPTSSTAPHTEASDTDSSSDRILKKYDDTLLLTERQLVMYLRKVSYVLLERITEDQ
nr:hypothetical protein [Tanacetum cinerariifolium]